MTDHKKRKIYVEKTGDDCQARIKEFIATHPNAAKNMKVEIVKGCEDKTLFIDYDDNDR